MSSKNEKGKVFVAMSGGVDSSVAAALFKKEGYDVTGVHMVCWDGCENSADRRDAMKVAAVLGIPFLTWDFRDEYKKEVYDYMIFEYVAGRTPNPDVMCNKEIKFGIFLKKTLESGADFIATGHYIKAKRRIFSQTDNSSRPARDDYLHSRPENFRFAKNQAFQGCESFSKTYGVSLFQAKDKNKDQSYFLWTLTQDQLKYCLFPIGDYLKSEVRELAKKFNLPVAKKKDSQGLCFVGKVDFLDFLKEKIPARAGDVLDFSGKKIGTHDGACFYTKGQRHGLKLGGLEHPVFVIEKDIVKNTITVAEAQSKDLFKKEVILKKISWISREEPKFPVSCFARIRYRQPLQKAFVSNNKVVFEKPQMAVASGQSVVFYSKKGEMFGGGVIA